MKRILKYCPTFLLASLVCPVVTFSSCSEEVEESAKIIRYTKPKDGISGVSEGVCFVDLGLPSGTMWAICNYGAANPNDFGDYFAWGEVNTKHSFSWENYKWNNGKYNKQNAVLDKNDDVATFSLNRFWHIPTSADWAELFDTANCKVSFVTEIVYGSQPDGSVDSSVVRDVVKGYKIESRSTAATAKGNSLFIRLASSRKQMEIAENDSAFFWLKDGLPADDPYTDKVEPFLGLPIRPVLNIPND